MSSKRVLLTNPPSGLYRRDDRCQSRVEEQTVQVIFPPIDLAYLAAVALKQGLEVHISDYPAERKSWDRFSEELKQFRPDFLLVNVTAATVTEDLQACRLAKETLPSCLTIARGDYLNVFGQQVMANNPYLDVVIIGEAEQTFAELIGSKPLNEINSIIYQQNTPSDTASIVKTRERELMENLDSLPFPARHLLNNELYRSPETGQRMTVIYANRGCPARCIFCPAGRLSQYRLRLRSPENVVDEVEECVTKFGFREFLFHGDTFTMNKRWVIDLCQLMVKRGLKIRWGCNSRVDTIDEERAYWLRRAGCWVVAFGVESGSQLLLDKMKKFTKVEQAREAVKICKKAGLLTHAFFIIGLPWENEATLQDTYQLARELNPDFFDFNIAYPLPGTEFYELAEQEGLLVAENAIREGSYAQAAVRSYYLSGPELTRWRKQALLRLYLRPRYIVRTVARNITSPLILFRYIGSAFRRLKQLISIKS